MKHQTCEFGRGRFDFWIVIKGHVYDVTNWGKRKEEGGREERRKGKRRKRKRKRKRKRRKISAND